MEKLGYGRWDELKAEARLSHRFRFDWYFKSRTPQELARRCDTLIRLVEAEKKEEEEGGGGGEKRAKGGSRASSAAPEEEEGEEKEEEGKQGSKRARSSSAGAAAVGAADAPAPMAVDGEQVAA